MSKVKVAELFDNVTRTEIARLAEVNGLRACAKSLSDRLDRLG